MVIVPFQAFSDTSRGGIVERPVQCARSSMHLIESAAPSGSSRFHCLMFATTLPLTLSHSDVIVV